MDLVDYLYEDGLFIMLYLLNEVDNTKKLQKSLVIKVFGGNLPFPIISLELRG